MVKHIHCTWLESEDRGINTHGAATLVGRDRMVRQSAKFLEIAHRPFLKAVAIRQYTIYPFLLVNSIPRYFDFVYHVLKTVIALQPCGFPTSATDSSNTTDRIAVITHCLTITITTYRITIFVTKVAIDRRTNI